MNGLLDIAWKIFLFVMLITCWRELIAIGISLLKMLGDLAWQFLDNIHDVIEDFLARRKG